MARNSLLGCPGSTGRKYEPRKALTGAQKLILGKACMERDFKILSNTNRFSYPLALGY